MRGCLSGNKASICLCGLEQQGGEPTDFPLVVRTGLWEGVTSNQPEIGTSYSEYSLVP